jgi:hypothetical protein
MMFVLFNSNMTGVTSGAGTANPSGAPEFTVGFVLPVFHVFSFILQEDALMTAGFGPLKQTI